MSARMKTGLSLLIFTVVISTLLMLGFYSYRMVVAAAARDTVRGADNVYLLTGEELQRLYAGDYAFSLSEEKHSPLRLIEKYEEQIAGNLPWLFGVVCLFLMGAGFLLWRILRAIYRKNVYRMILELSCDSDQEIMQKGDHLSLGAYRYFRKIFNDRASDYTRLHSYLSHEQKNAISILRTSLELSRSEEQLKILDEISNSIDDILTLSDTGGLSEKQPVDVLLLCAGVCDTYRAVYPKITFSFDENLCYTVSGKERWIYRAISNLLDNAVKYGKDGPIEVSVTNKNNSVIIRVQDWGVGIDADNQDKIFENRFRIRKLHKDGYGIGLSLVSHVCDLCGGFAWVDSRVDDGSTFYLSFPCELTSN